MKAVNIPLLIRFPWYFLLSNSSRKTHKHGDVINDPSPRFKYEDESAYQRTSDATVWTGPCFACLLYKTVLSGTALFLSRSLHNRWGTLRKHRVVGISLRIQIEGHVTVWDTERFVDFSLSNPKCMLCLCSHSKRATRITWEDYVICSCTTMDHKRTRVYLTCRDHPACVRSSLLTRKIPIWATARLRLRSCALAKDWRKWQLCKLLDEIQNSSGARVEYRNIRSQSLYVSNRICQFVKN